MQRIVVVGGNGFIGSAVCRLALSRGMQVTSISSSGKPYQTPKGHTPDWSAKVNWQKADALDPSTYRHILPGASSVVHTLGTLFEDVRYKDAIKRGDITEFAAIFASLENGNPLSGGPSGSVSKTGYNALNRDSALRMCETFISSDPPPNSENVARPFVYISAEDVFRPLVPARYIESKREAEAGIEDMIASQPAFRSAYIRPSLVYHPHYRPLTSPIAALLDLSATLHANAPEGLPTPASALRTLGSRSELDANVDTDGGGSALHSVANALTIPPIHVDHVAEAAVIAADWARTDVRGVFGVHAIRELIGWKEKGAPRSARRRRFGRSSSATMS